jgi:hypothetical protein
VNLLFSYLLTGATASDILLSLVSSSGTTITLLGSNSDVGPIWGDSLAAALLTTPGNITLQTKYSIGVSILGVFNQNFVNASRVSVPHMGPNGRAIIKYSVVDSSEAEFGVNDVVSVAHSSDELISTTLEWNGTRFVLPLTENGNLDKSKVLYTHRSTVGADATRSPESIVPASVKLVASFKNVASALVAASWKLDHDDVMRNAVLLSIFGKVPLFGHIATTAALAFGNPDVRTVGASFGWNFNLGVKLDTDPTGVAPLSANASVTSVFQVLHDAETTF